LALPLFILGNIFRAQADSTTNLDRLQLAAGDQIVNVCGGNIP
jgi:hypothetical protein